MNIENSYRIKDLSLASFLYASGAKLIKLDNQNHRVWFLFDDKPSCERSADSFWRKDAIVNAKEFADAFRTLKDLIFNK